MATIRKLPSGKWNVQIRSKGKLVASRTFKLKSSALKWAKSRDDELVGEHLYFIDAGHGYCQQMLAGKPSLALTSNRVDRISAHTCMAKTMDRITLQDVNSYKQERLADVSTTTCRDELMLIKRVFRWYIQESYASTGKRLANPCEFLSIPRPNRPSDRVISRRELGLLLSAMSPDMAVIVELAYETAMRRGELLKLRPCDLFLSDRFLRVVDGKEGSRDVPLTRRAVVLLEYALEHRAGERSTIFNVAPYSVTQAVRRARDLTGLGSGVRFHQLRHSRITEVARMGLNQAQIMVVSGHRDIRSVQRYTHLCVRDVVDLID